MINAERIAEMKRLSAEATEGEWVARGLNSLDYARVEVDVTEYESKVVVQSLSNGDIKFIAESRQFVPDIIAAYEETKLSAEAYELMVRGLNGMVAERDAEIAKLRKALEYYADDIHYDPYFFDDKTCDVTEDGGYIARDALK